MKSSAHLKKEEDWREIKKTTVQSDVMMLLSRAKRLIRQADTKDRVLELIDTYLDALRIDPDNYEALWSLGRYYQLMGFAYSHSIPEKEQYYLAQIRSCERAMETNHPYKALIENGEPVEKACRALTEREMHAIAYWSFGYGAYYKECFGRIGKLMKISLAVKARKVAERMMEINPTFDGGHPLVFMAGYYALLPQLLGGDTAKAADFYARAVKAGPKRLFARYCRARFLYTKMENRKAFREDLEWVIAQDPHMLDSPYAWNVFFQSSAREMLRNMHTYFK